MKTVSLVVPTMPRKSNGLNYLRQSLARSELNFPSCDKKFFFVEKRFEENVLAVAKQNNFDFECIYRDESDELYKLLSGINKNSYQYWRKHLCLDFCYSMSMALERCDSQYIVWLEDDTVVTNDFEESFGLVTEEMKAVNFYHKIGFCCQMFEREFLKELIEFIKEDKNQSPLDYKLREINEKRYKSVKKCAYHIGRVSSRKDTKIIRPNEMSKLKQIK